MSVTAVIVAADQSYLEHTLVALSEQHFAPERIILVNASTNNSVAELADTATEAGAELPIEVHQVPNAKNFGDAIRGALDEAPEIVTEWLWLLHDDSPPAPEALAELLKATASSRAVGIAGCKQVDFTERTRLLSVGVQHTRAGRRLAEIEPGEIDQGQYDHREDVYAVGTAGMLIRTGTWNAVGGTDPALGPFLDGAELCRRVRLAGERVIVVPAAKVRHARAALWHGPGRDRATIDGANSFLARRVATLHFRIVSINLWALLFAAVAMLLAAPLRALWRVSANDLTLALEELRAPVTALSRVGRIFRSRRAIAKVSKASRRVLSPLQATRSQVWRLWWHRWRARRVERRRRAAPSELEIAERRTIAIRRRLTFVAVILTLAGLGAILTPHVFAGSIFNFPPLVGGGLSGIDGSYPELWEKALSAWAPVGDGAALPAHPFAVVLAALATVVGGPFGVSVHASVSLLLTLALPLAGISAWFAAGGLTRSVLLRGWAALVWAFLPVLLLGVNHGRISAVLAHILLPLLGLALARTFGVNQRDVIRSGLIGAGEEGGSNRIPVISKATGVGSAGAAAAAGLLLAAVTASAPVLLPGLALALIIIAVFAPGNRLRLLVVALPSIVLFIPQAVAARDHGWSRLLFAPETPSINLAEFSDDPSWLAQTPWYAISGWVTSPPVVAAAVVAGIIGAAAFMGLFRRGYVGRAARWGWLVSGIGVLTAVGAQHLLREPQHDWLGSFQQLPEWPGPGVSLAAAGMIAAAICAVSGISQKLSSYGLGWRHGGVAIVVAGLVVVAAAGGVHTAGVMLQEPQWHARDVDPLPALARQTVTGSERSRVLMVAPQEGTIAGQLWRSNGPQFLDVDQRIQPGDEAHESLSVLVAEMAAGSAQDAGPRLAQHAVGLVLIPSAESPQTVVDPVAREELAAALDGMTDLERVTENEAGTLWRVTANAARVRVVAGNSQTPVPSGMTSVDATLPELAEEDDEAVVVLAERADARWRATLDGEPLRSVDAGWRQAFALPEQASGELRIEYAPMVHRGWQIAFIAVFGFTAVLSLPVRRRPEVVA